MNPCFFGTRERRLFGMQEFAPGRRLPARAAVLCHPLGEEYIHAHRTMRQLAQRLGTAGYDTFRFDYYGTGDSAGESRESSLAGCQADIETAIDESCASTQCDRVTLIGMRMGANVAARVASRRPERVEALVLWDPVLPLPQAIEEPATSEAGELFDLPGLLQMRTLVVTSGPQPELERRLESVGGDRHGMQAELVSVTGIKAWQGDPLQMGVVPAEALRRIVAWLA